MKKINLLAYAMLISLCAIFVGCNNDDDSPSIRVTVNGNTVRDGGEMTVREGTTLNIVFTYTAESGFRELEWGIDGDDRTIRPNDWDSNTRHVHRVTHTVQGSNNRHITAAVEDIHSPSRAAAFQFTIRVN